MSTVNVRCVSGHKRRDSKRHIFTVKYCKGVPGGAVFFFGHSSYFIQPNARILIFDPRPSPDDTLTPRPDLDTGATDGKGRKGKGHENLLYVFLRLETLSARDMFTSGCSDCKLSTHES